MLGIAAGELRGVKQHGMHVLQHQTAEMLVLLHGVAQIVGVDAEGISPELNDSAVGGNRFAEYEGYADHTFASDQPNLDRFALAGVCQHRNNPALDEIGMFHRRVEIIQHALGFQRDAFEFRPEILEVLNR